MLNTLFDSLLMDSNGTLNITPGYAVICAITALVLGFIIALVYMGTTEKYSKDFVITLVILPALVMTVIMMVNGNVGTGIATMGAFSLVRFRSLPGTAKEIVAIFFSMAAGLSCGLGYITYAVCITIILSLALVFMNLVSFGESKNVSKNLKVTIPEDLDYTNIFDDIFSKYTVHAQQLSVKTTNLGSLFVVTYAVELKPDMNEKEFIDEIRCRNGNLTVTLNHVENAVSL